MNKQNSAVKTLEALGYTYSGGELWKPPVGNKPDFNLIDKLNARIKELESDKHINEIKAQGILEAVTFADKWNDQYDFAIEYRIDIFDYIEQLRNNHE